MQATNSGVVWDFYRPVRHASITKVEQQEAAKKDILNPKQWATWLRNASTVKMIGKEWRRQEEEKCERREV